MMNFELVDYIETGLSKLRYQQLEVLPQQEAELILGLALMHAGRNMTLETFKNRCAQLGDLAIAQGRQAKESICLTLGVKMKSLDDAIKTVSKHKTQIENRRKAQKNENIKQLDKKTQARHKTIYA